MIFDTVTLQVIFVVGVVPFHPEESKKMQTEVRTYGLPRFFAERKKEATCNTFLLDLNVGFC
jgi:hypothetical protein